MNGMLECCFPRLTDSITQWQQRRRNIFGKLPKDLVPEILSRLPLTCAIRCRLVCKQWYAMIGTHFFLEMHHNNQPYQEPTFGFVIEFPDEVSAVGYHYFFFSMDKKAADCKRFEMLTQLLDDDLSASAGNSHLNSCQTTLISSYKGFLLITATDLMSELALIFYNPLTAEEVIVISSTRYSYCGFFFHSPTKEYRVLYQMFEEKKKDVCVGFQVYGLQTRSLRKINTNFSAKHHPDSSTTAVISNGCLYWMVSETHHMNTFGILPSCSEAILSFEIESEEFRLMPHPVVFHDCRAQSSTCPGHKKMHLLEMEGQLCLCNGYSLRVEIWVMEDYTKWIWVKRHVVKLDSFLSSSSSSSSAGLPYAEGIKALQIHQGELLLECNTQQFGREYFLCRFKRDPNACTDNKDLEHHSEHVIFSKGNIHFQVAIDRLPIDNHSSSDEEIVRRINIKNLLLGHFLRGLVVLSHSLISLHKSEPRRLKVFLPSP